MNADDALRKIEGAASNFEGAFRNATSTPKNEPVIVAVVVPAPVGLRVEGLISRRQEQSLKTSLQAGAPSAELRGRGLQHLAVGAFTITSVSQEQDRHWAWIERMANLGDKLLAMSGDALAEWFARDTYQSARELLAPNAKPTRAADMRELALAMTAIAFIVHYPQVRRGCRAATQHLRITGAAA